MVLQNRNDRSLGGSLEGHFFLGDLVAVLDNGLIVMALWPFGRLLNEDVVIDVSLVTLLISYHPFLKDIVFPCAFNRLHTLSSILKSQ